MPSLHGSVAGRGTQPTGCEIEKPLRVDVNVSVNAGGATIEALGDALGVGDGDGDGLAVG
jgi:hypothetical protein